MSAGADRTDVCVVGSANLDLVATAAVLPHPGETVIGREYQEHPGGKGLNQAVAAARAGAVTTMIAALGEDPAGDLLTAVMHADGIDTARVSRHPGTPTGRALIGVADDGENQIIVVPGANAVLAAADVAELPGCRVLLTQLEVPLDTVRAALAAARRAGITTVLNPAPAHELDRSVLALVDIVVPNEHELRLLGGVDALLTAGAQAVIVTRGAAGVSVHDGHQVVEVPALPVATLDTTGAGDTFCGSLCARLALGDPLAAAVRYAVAAAALSTTVAGAVPSIPSASAVAAALAAVTEVPGAG